MTISQLCCAAAGLGLVGLLLLIWLWAMCIVAALDRRIDGNEIS
jgi:hypothetical protein